MCLLQDSSRLQQKHGSSSVSATCTAEQHTSILQQQVLLQGIPCLSSGRRTNMQAEL